MPTPQKTIELLKGRPGYEEAHREGLIGLILDPLVDQRLFESLMTKSRDSYASGIRHWIMFTEVLRIPPDQQLDVTAQNAARWLATFNVKGTAEAYRTHLKYACTIARKSTAWATEGDLVRRVLEGIGKGPENLPVKPIRWTCRRHKAVQLVQWAKTQDDLGLQAVVILGYNFQFRVVSELFKLLLNDCFVEKIGESLKLVIWINGRKNRRERHPLT